MSAKKIDTKALLGCDAAEMRQVLRQLMPAIEMPKIDPWYSGVLAQSEQMRRQWAFTVEALNRTMEPFKGVLETLAREEQKYGRIDAAGWLPHHTTPFDELEEVLDARAIAQRLTAFYRERWPDVKAAFLSKLTGYDVDSEAKATFVEALEAHEAGHYRCVPRLLFPEVERMVRDEFFPGDLNKRLASQGDLRKAVSYLPAFHVSVNVAAGLRLYEKLADHLYLHIDSDLRLAEVANDPVPNRHAAIHGLVVYKTEQTSLNALIMTEFVYSLMSVLKRGERDAAA